MTSTPKQKGKEPTNEPTGSVFSLLKAGVISTDTAQRLLREILGAEDGDPVCSLIDGLAQKIGEK